MSEPQVLSDKEIANLLTNVSESFPVYEGDDRDQVQLIEELRLDICNLIATVRAKEAEIVELNNRIGNQSESINHLAHENKNLAWKNARLAGEKVNLQTAYNEAAAVIGRIDLINDSAPIALMISEFLAKHKEATK